MPSALSHDPAITVPGASTDNAIVIFDGTGGTGFGNSTILVDSGGNGRIGIATDTNIITLTNETVAVAGAITGVTALTVDNININGNTISSTAGTDLLITPLAGQQLILDGTIIIDAGVVTGVTSFTVDNINIDGNTISSTAGTDLLITPLAGQQLILDGTIIIDAGVVTGITALTVTGNILPGANNSHDLGSSSYQWQNIYTQDFHLNNTLRDEGNSIDGTKGNWTIQEGDENLFIVNNKTGKKYRFLLTEVS